MDWRTEGGTIFAALIGAVLGSAWAPKLLGDRWLEKVKAHYSKELAEIEHKLSILLSDRQNAFTMAANSPMATTLFDKYIGFCEEYVRAISNTLYSLIQEGKRDQPLDARELFRIRQKWALWLYDNIEFKLDRFEHGFEGMGGAQVLDADGAAMSRERSIRSVIGVLRRTLATEEFANRRNELVRDLVTKQPRVP